MLYSLFLGAQENRKLISLWNDIEAHSVQEHTIASMPTGQEHTIASMPTVQEHTITSIPIVLEQQTFKEPIQAQDPLVFKTYTM